MYIEKEEFKIGDTVVCIKPDTSNPGITEGSLYTILKLDSLPHYELGIIVENDYGDRQFYYAHQFIKFYQIEKETEMALTCTMNAEQIRDEILRIDVRIEEAKKDIENAEKERNSLVEKLREKGFEIIGMNSVTVSYFNVGDRVEVTGYSPGRHTDSHIGRKGIIEKIDDSGIPFKLVLDGESEYSNTWFEIDQIKKI